MTESVDKPKKKLKKKLRLPKELAESHKIGRPPVYNEEWHCDQATKFARLGLVNDEIANIFNIDRDTFYEWLKHYPAFPDALRAGREESDAYVADALFHRAKGYSHPETKVFSTKDGGIVTEEVEKHYPPDTAAAIIWLKNRQPKKWREKVEIDNNINMTPDSIESLKSEIQSLVAENGFHETKELDEE